MRPRAVARAVVRFWAPPPGFGAFLVGSEDPATVKAVLLIILAILALLAALAVR